MPIFKFHFRHREYVELDDTGIEYPDLHQAYLQAYASIPDMARDLLIAGKDPMECAHIISDADGRSLMEVPFTEAHRNRGFGTHAVALTAILGPNECETIRR